MSNRSNSANWLRDGNLAFHGGVDGSVPPSDLPRNQCARAINCTMRGGPIKPRPGWQPRPLTFSNDWNGADITQAFENARFQHASFYAHPTNPALISVQGGRVFYISLADFSVQEITPHDGAGVIDRNSSLPQLGWSEQAENYWIYQDNQSYPIIFNGTACRRSNPAQNEVPVGNVMAYAQGRLVVALPDRQTYRVGDLLFSPASGTPAANYKDAVLRFTENNYLSEGGDFIARVFGAASKEGKITGMKSIAQTNMQLGQGPLLIGTPYTMFTIQLPFDRTTWKDLPNPQQTNSPIMGPLSNDSMVLVNGDIWYRSVDGIRSLIMAYRDFSTWGNTPLSAEVGPHLKYDTMSLLEHTSAVLFDNRLLTTISPAPNAHGVFFRGLAVIDFNLISTLTKKMQPAWEGVWTGNRTLKIVKGLVENTERCFAFTLSDECKIELWELVPDSKFDDTDTAINWSFELPSYNCGDSDRFKRLETARIIINELQGTLTGTVKYRTDLNPCWMPWDEFEVCAKREDCCTDLTTTTTAQFTVPDAPESVEVTVASTAEMSTDQPTITIGGYTLTLLDIIDGNTISVQNATGAQDGLVVASGASVAFCGYECEGPHTWREQQRTPVRLKMPPDTFDEVTGEKLRTGFEFQPRLEMAGGYGEIRQIRIYALDAPEQLGIKRRDEI